MGLFRKKKGRGWDDDAATNYHDQAPAAEGSEIPAKKVGNLHNPPSNGNVPGGENAAANQTPSTNPSKDTGTAGNGEVQHEKQPDYVSESKAPESSSVSSNESRVTLMPVADMRSSLSQVVPLVQNLKSDVEKLKEERVRLEEELERLKEEIEELEANAPEFDSVLREMVDSLNEEITREFVAGVESVEIPYYKTPNELVGIIDFVGSHFEQMLPPLTKSRDSAASMLETLVPDSNMYAPTKQLLDFSKIAVEKTETFFAQKTELRKRLETALRNHELLSDAFQKSKQRSDANLIKVNNLAETILNVTDEFRQLGAALEDIRWSSFGSE